VGGQANSSAGDGYYNLSVDLKEGTVDRCFYRLYGDVTGDRVVDNQDLYAIAAAMGHRGSGISADVNGDGIVDFRDKVWTNAAAGISSPPASGWTGRGPGWKTVRDSSLAESGVRP
jgi:hypothetical protein